MAQRPLLNVRLDADLIEHLNRRAKEHETTVAGYLRQLIRADLEATPHPRDLAVVTAELSARSALMLSKILETVLADQEAMRRFEEVAQQKASEIIRDAMRKP